MLSTVSYIFYELYSMFYIKIPCLSSLLTFIKQPYSLVVRASASGVVGCGFALRLRHTKGVKNGTSSSLADAGIKRVVLGR